MTTQMFLGLLLAFGTISSLFTECIKKIISDKENMSYNVLAIIVSLIVGGGGTAIYYQLSGIAFTVNNIIFMVLMGLASGLVSMGAYDKIKQLIAQLAVIKESTE